MGTDGSGMSSIDHGGRGGGIREEEEKIVGFTGVN
jgi:hypothetical protein